MSMHGPVTKVYSCLVASQTLQTPLDLLASCDRGHDWDITENLWTGLQQWTNSKAELALPVSGHVDMPTCKQMFTMRKRTAKMRKKTKTDCQNI